jgi:16S rRNA (guanine527-N7)-methyltransferase
MTIKGENKDLSDREIATLLLPFGVHLSADQMSQVREYIRILLKWNELINLTTIIEPAEIIARHFGESMFLHSILPVENGRLADVGSGAGFPGLALKILSPGVHALLIESNKRKCAFISEVVRSLELPGVEILPMRFEEIRPQTGFANFVTARAVGGFPNLLRWARTSLSEGGHIALWVGGEDTIKISNSRGWNWQPAVRIPESQRRFILVGRPLP